VEQAVAQDPFALDEVAPGIFVTAIDHRLCVGPPGMHFLFGGAGMALATRAIEGHGGEPLRWLTLQYVAPTLLGTRLELTIQRQAGDRVAQVAVTGRADGHTVLQGLAAVGRRVGAPEIQTETMPRVSPPLDHPVVHPHKDSGRDAHQNVEIRLARGRFGIFSKAPVSTDGHVHAWMRPTHGTVDAAALAFMADFVPSTTSNALAVRSGGSSLDNTLRVVRLVPTRWVFCDIAISAIAEGIAHGGMRLFAEDGTLMALAGQSFMPRIHPPRDGVA
jgi:acyl-CoA thioesterase II